MSNVVYDARVLAGVVELTTSLECELGMVLLPGSVDAGLSHAVTTTAEHHRTNTAA
jgi:hypothetical protein